MRFRPSGGLSPNQKPDRGALEARAELTGHKSSETVFDQSRHEQEIERAENLAANIDSRTSAKAPVEVREPQSPDIHETEHEGFHTLANALKLGLSGNQLAQFQSFLLNHVLVFGLVFHIC